MTATAVKLGIFVLICLGFTAWLGATIGNIHPFRDTYRLTASFDDVSGLLLNDNVKIAGVVVGKVNGIEVSKGTARVTFEVRDGVKVPDDSTAAIRWRNLLGQRYVYLNPGASSTVLQSGDHLADTESVVDLGELFNRLGPIVAAIDPAQVNEFLDAVVGALDGNEVQVQQIIRDLGALTDTLAERDDAIGRMIENLNTVAGTIADRDQQIRAMLDNLVVISSTFSANTDVVDAAITELGDFSAHLAALLGGNRAEVDRIIANLGIIVDTVGGKLDTVEHLVANLDEGAKRLFTASRFGTWLNQVIPCGAAGDIPLDQSCTTSTDQTGPPQEPSGPGAQGRDAVLDLLALGVRA